MTPHNPIPVVFYKEDGSENEPVKKWLYSLDKECRKIIGKDMRTVQLGWPLGMPLVRNLGDGLWEMRFGLPKNIARIIFKMINGEMVLLHGFIKKTQKTPIEDLQLAKTRARKYEKMEKKSHAK
ncbi:MAG TPA: type II toxin-antitoxin system RelE/ParE family toxin [Rhabdochlamydiaceae bacterium]|nr:type II toxin-antitoxin system RelE/ParE family toxin [Rhabdochlamydiaceae bacterium]